MKLFSPKCLHPYEQVRKKCKLIMASLQFLYIISTTTELLDLTSEFYVLVFLIFYLYVYCKNLRLTNVRRAQYKMMFV